MKKIKNSKRISLARDLEKPAWKIRLIGGFMLLLFIGVSIKALELQVLSRDPALTLARKQHQAAFMLLPRRGKILDAKEKELSENVDAESVYVRSKNVENPIEFSKKLSSYLDVSREEILAMLLSGKPFVWLKRLAEPELIAKLKAGNLVGIDFIEEPKRVYPNGYLAGQVLGFTNIDSKGIEGVEYYLDDLLAGKPGKIIVMKDARGREIVSAPIDIEKSTSGYDAVLTIDYQIQNIVESELKEGVERSKAEKGMAILMNSETGAIMAMASYPFFDPNKFDKYSGETKRNLPIWYSFEPGSTMKVFLVSAALEEKKVSSTSEFNCENGKRRVGSSIISDVHPYGILTVAQVVKLSSNVCASKIGEVLGRDKLYAYLKSFGFGERTGIDLPGESGGRLRKSRDWRPIELATVSFGQGISVTALQLASALSAVANGGYLVKPYAVEKIVGSDGKIIQQNKAEPVRRVISYETAIEVTKMLEGVITKGGTGENAAVPEYRVAGKTGTAQIPNPQTGGYFTDRHMASFIGFAPADDPKLTLVVVVDSPKTSPYGGVVAAPIFKGIMEKALFYLGVPPRKTIAQSRVMPNLLGMSARDVLRWAEKAGVEVKIKGSGSVTTQKPQAGEIIKEDTLCSIELKKMI